MIETRRSKHSERRAARDMLFYISTSLVLFRPLYRAADTSRLLHSRSSPGNPGKIAFSGAGGRTLQRTIGSQFMSTPSRQNRRLAQMRHNDISGAIKAEKSSVEFIEGI